MLLLKASWLVWKAILTDKGFACFGKRNKCVTSRAMDLSVLRSVTRTSFDKAMMTDLPVLLGKCEEGGSSSVRFGSQKEHFDRSYVLCVSLGVVGVKKPTQAKISITCSNGANEKAKSKFHPFTQDIT